MSEFITFNKPSEAGLNRPFLSKGDYAYKLLKDKIVNGYLERNKIYTIVEIAESLGLSRTPVGEAVKILGSQNYIILYPGVGFKVKELNTADISENLTISGALEAAILKKIVAEGPASTQDLEKAVGDSWLAIKNQTPELYTLASANFHKAFYALACLPKVTEILHENVFVHEIWYRKGASKYPEAIQRLIIDHENIIEVIQTQSHQQIGEVIDRHVENCKEVLLKVIQG